MNKQIPIVLAFTVDYFTPAIVTIYSILESSSNFSRKEIYCLVNRALNEEEKKCLLYFQEVSNIHIINMEGMIKKTITHRYSEASLYRLLLPDLLKEEDWVIYLDCDIIVRNDIAELKILEEYKDKYLGVVYESPTPWDSEYKNKIVKDINHYFNSGFLLMNLKIMRKYNLVKKILSMSFESSLRFPDQDALNMVCEGKVFGIEPKYNSIRTFRALGLRNYFLKIYTTEQWKEMRAEGNVHFTSDKPWEKPVLDYVEWWQRYEMVKDILPKRHLVKTKMSIFYRFTQWRIVTIILNYIKKYYYNLGIYKLRKRKYER